MQEVKDNTKKHIRSMLILFCALFIILSVYLVYIVNAYGTRWFTSPYNTRLQAQKSSVISGMILDRNGVRLAYTDEDGERHYYPTVSRRRAVSHVVGDNYGQTMGAESMYAKYLLGFDQNLSERVQQMLSGETRTGSSVMLSVDSELCEYAYDLMDDYWGAVVLMNYETGEILVSVSQPTFDPESMRAYLADEKELAGSAMVNRVTMGRYVPGSTFKTVTLVAALRYLPDIENRIFQCDSALVFDKESGKYLPDVQVDESAFSDDFTGKDYDREEAMVDDESAEPAEVDQYSIVRDSHGEYHGTITLLEAYAESCNNTFGKLAMEIGATRMKQVANSLDIGDEFLFDDMILYSSSYTKADNQRNLAWSGVGQYKDLMTPMQMCMLTAAVANDGVMMAPRMLSKVADNHNVVTYSTGPQMYDTLLTTEEAAFVQKAMIRVVTDGTGTKAAVKGYVVGGKTGTAEISENKEVNTHAWFTGFIQDEDHPLAICIILEQAGSGGSVAAPIAAKIFKKAIALGY